MDTVLHQEIRRLVGIVVHFGQDTQAFGSLYELTNWWADLALSGATVRVLQVIAGHTTATMAVRYQEVARDHLADVFDRLCDTIDGAKQA
jgi:site-specific recombinase XerD